MKKMKVEDIKLGQRVRLLASYDCYPFVDHVPAGRTGTIVDVGSDMKRNVFFWVSFDRNWTSYNEEEWRDNDWPMRGVEFNEEAIDDVVGLFEVVR